MVINGSRIEDVIYFNADDTATRTISNGRRLKHVDEYMEKQQVIDAINKAVIKDNLKKALRKSDEERLTYTFKFDEYNRRRDERKKSTVRIVIPNEYYDKKDSNILALDAITEAKCKINSMNAKMKFLFAGASLILITAMTPKMVENFIAKDNQRYEQELEYQKQKVEELTGRTMEEIVETPSTMEENQAFIDAKKEAILEDKTNSLYEGQQELETEKKLR